MAQITDDDRKRLAEALALALLAVYNGAAQTALEQLGLAEQEFHATPEMIAVLNKEAADVAATVQAGINTRLQDAQSGADDAPTVEQVQQEVDQYNATVLIPYLTSWASHRAISDVYETTPNPDNPDQSMRDAVQWQWDQHTDFLDDCTSAMEASPDTFDNLVAIAGGIPAVHRHCLCTLSPVTA